MKSVFEPGEKASMFSLESLHEEAALWGKRLFAPRLPEMHNSTWEIVWYRPEGYSTPHLHACTESVYYFDFDGKAGKCNVFVGWPLSQAEITEISGPTLMYIPAHVVHCFNNVGDTEMLLVHSFSPPWERDRGTTTDITDMLTGRMFTDLNDYGTFVNTLCEKCSTFPEYVEYVKALGKY